jgi:peptidoglycan/xylan/chitin deacetylase (PgdA/CDA1 family)
MPDPLYRTESVLLQRLRLLPAAFALLLFVTGATVQAEPAPVRFLLTFDDGPASAVDDNPTVHILEVLARNPYQDQIKAVFFTQTRAWNGGGTDVGRSLIRREHVEGHVIGLHSATPMHSNHRFMSREHLDETIKLGVNDLTTETGITPKLVRPPFWSYDADTLASYHANGLQMLLTDLSANDGVIYGINFSWHKRSNMLKLLGETRKRWAAGAMPAVDGYTPVVVTFHDVNTYTSRHIEEYLAILLDAARELNVPLATRPFYDDRSDLERAALAATVSTPDSTPRLPGLWNWLWK